MYKRLTTPLDSETIKSLEIGDRILIRGKIYSARDAAHKRMCEVLNNEQELPFDIKGQIIYYAGPCPPKPNCVSGPFGPTTSGRMDAYTPQILKQGLKAMIGKGERSHKVVESMKKEGAVYFVAIGGAGALIATKIKSQKVIAYDELGAEALRELWVEDFPVILAIDSLGNNLFETEPSKYSNQYSQICKKG